MESNHGHVLTSRQLRAVRAWLGWGQKQLADYATLSPTTIVNWENEKRTPYPSTAVCLMLAITRLGIRFDKVGNLILPP